MIWAIWAGSASAYAVMWYTVARWYTRDMWAQWLHVNRRATAGERSRAHRITARFGLVMGAVWWMALAVYLVNWGLCALVDHLVRKTRCDELERPERDLRASGE